MRKLIYTVEDCQHGNCYAFNRRDQAITFSIKSFLREIENSHPDNFNARFVIESIQQCIDESWIENYYVIRETDYLDD